MSAVEPSDRGSRRYEVAAVGFVMLLFAIYFGYATLWSYVWQLRAHSSFVPVTAEVIESSVGTRGTAATTHGQSFFPHIFTATTSLVRTTRVITTSSRAAAGWIAPLQRPRRLTSALDLAWRHTSMLTVPRVQSLTGANRSSVPCSTQVRSVSWPWSLSSMVCVSGAEPHRSLRGRKVDRAHESR